MVTKEQFAAMLNGREYGNEVTHAECELAKENGLVVVFGQSDDLMEFEGAIRDKVSCYDGGFAYLDAAGVWWNKCNDDCPYAQEEATKRKSIRAVWTDKGAAAWTYETEIPHATFNIYEDGELWCVGLVFEMAALRDEQERVRRLAKSLKWILANVPDQGPQTFEHAMHLYIGAAVEILEGQSQSLEEE